MRDGGDHSPALARQPGSGPDGARRQARREAELIITQAHAEAREIQRRALAEHERLDQESRRLRVQLQAALAALDDTEQAAAPEPEAVADEDEDDTEERSWYGMPDASAA